MSRGVSLGTSPDNAQFAQGITSSVIFWAAGVLVSADRGQEQAQQEATKQLEELQDLFGMMDDNGDGTLSWSEFKAGMSGNLAFAGRVGHFP